MLILVRNCQQFNCMLQWWFQCSCFSYNGEQKKSSKSDAWVLQFMPYCCFTYSLCHMMHFHKCQSNNHGGVLVTINAAQIHIVSTLLLKFETDCTCLCFLVCFSFGYVFEWVYIFVSDETLRCHFHASNWLFLRITHHMQRLASTWIIISLTHEQEHGFWEHYFFWVCPRLKFSTPSPWRASKRKENKHEI